MGERIDESKERMHGPHTRQISKAFHQRSDEYVSLTPIHYTLVHHDYILHMSGELEKAPVTLGNRLPSSSSHRTLFLVPLIDYRRSMLGSFIVYHSARLFGKR